MNILIANISAFAYKADVIHYEVKLPNCSVSEYDAQQTNESVFKCLAHLDEVVSSGGIHKIIALVTKKVLDTTDERYDRQTAWEYFSKVVKECNPFKDTEYVMVRVDDENGNVKEIHCILDEICKNVSEQDVVYIDAAGGQRTINNAIQLVAKLLKYKGINNPYSFYSNIQSGQGYIEDTSYFDKLVKLTEAFNEFMTTGKSNQLRECLTLTSNLMYHSLVDTMCEVSEKISLGYLEKLDDSLTNLNDALRKCGNIEDCDVESVVIRQFLPIIRKKFLGDSDKTSGNDYCRLVRWCLENGLIQQALTIFVEKAPIVFFNKGLISYNGDLEKFVSNYYKESKGNPLKSVDWQTSTFYIDILGDAVLSDSKKKVEELKSCLKSLKGSKDSVVQPALKLIRSYHNHALESRLCSPKKSVVEKWLKEKRFTSYDKFVNALCNNEKIMLEILGLQDVSESSSNSLERKFAFVKKVEENKIAKVGQFSFHADNIAEIMYGYLYVKSIRNTINHASSEENLNDAQKMVLEGHGYIFDGYNVRTIVSNVERAIDSIEYAEVIDKSKCS